MSLRRGLLASLAVVTVAGLLAVIMLASNENGASDPGPLTAETRADTSSSTTSVPATTSPPAPASSPGATEPAAATTTTATTAASTTTSTTMPMPTTTSTTSTTVVAHTAAECPDPGPSSDFAAFHADVVVIHDDDGAHQSCMLIADTPERRRQGLMGQDDLDGYAGMAFVFEDEQERSFWMHDTRIPLSIAFFDGRGGFVSSKDMEPCDQGIDCPTYSSDGPAQFAIEVPQGRLASVGATPGSRFEH